MLVSPNPYRTALTLSPPVGAQLRLALVSNGGATEGLKFRVADSILSFDINHSESWVIGPIYARFETALTEDVFFWESVYVGDSPP